MTPEEVEQIGINLNLPLVKSFEVEVVLSQIMKGGIIPTIKDEITLAKSILLFYSIYTNNDDLCEKILDFDDVSPNIALDLIDHFTPLMLACKIGNIQIVTLLTQRGVNINAINETNKTPLIYAAMYGHVKIVQKLIKIGVNLTPNQRGSCLLKTPLYRKGNSTADIFGNYGSGVGAMLQAASNGHVEVIVQLLEAGISVNAKDCTGKTALHCAALTSNNGLTISALIRAKANIEEPDQLGFTPLMLAASKGKLCVAETLINNGANINTPNIHEFPAPTYAMLLGDRAKIGTHNSTVDKLMGASALSYAAEAGQTEMVGFLISKGADINIRNKSGETPLIIAVGQINIETVKMLLEKGADWQAKDIEGRSALSLAMTLNLKIQEVNPNLDQIIELLEKLPKTTRPIADDIT